MQASLPILTRTQAGLIRRLLGEKKIRTREGAFVVEGAKFCRDLISRHPSSILSLTLSSSYLRNEDARDRLMRFGLAVPQCACSDVMFGKLSDVDAPQGILAVVRQPEWDEAKVWAQPHVFGVYGERLRDPLNVGTIIRTAAALNLTGVWLSSDAADCFNPKVVRAAAGALLSLPIFRTENVQTFVHHGCSLYAAVVSCTGAVPLRSITEIPHRLMVAVGNEGQGLTSDVVTSSDVLFSIPLARQVESLNVAVTAAISAFYLSGLPVKS